MRVPTNSAPATSSAFRDDLADVHRALDLDLALQSPLRALCVALADWEHWKRPVFRVAMREVVDGTLRADELATRYTPYRGAGRRLLASIFEQARTEARGVGCGLSSDLAARQAVLNYGLRAVRPGEDLARMKLVYGDARHWSAARAVVRAGIGLCVAHEDAHPLGTDGRRRGAALLCPTCSARPEHEQELWERRIRELLRAAAGACHA